MAAAAERKFTAYRKGPLRSVEVFKYLGQFIAQGDCDTLAIQRNLKRARQVSGDLQGCHKGGGPSQDRRDVLPGRRRCFSTAARRGVSPAPPGSPSAASKWRRRGASQVKFRTRLSAGQGGNEQWIYLVSNSFLQGAISARIGAQMIRLKQKSSESARDIPKYFCLILR